MFFGRFGTAEAEPSSDQTLDAPMILLDNIIIWHV